MSEGGPAGPGFGGAPPRGGAEGPLAHIPFTPEDDANLTWTGRFARFAGVAAVLSAVLTVLGRIVAVIATDRATPATIAGQLCGGVIPLLIALALATFLFRVARAVDLVVATDDADQENLVAALRSLRAYFTLKGIVYIVLMAFACLLLGGSFLFGAALMSRFGGH